MIHRLVCVRLILRFTLLQLCLALFLLPGIDAHAESSPTRSTRDETHVEVMGNMVFPLLIDFNMSSVAISAALRPKGWFAIRRQILAVQDYDGGSLIDDLTLELYPFADWSNRPTWTKVYVDIGPARASSTVCTADRSYSVFCGEVRSSGGIAYFGLRDYFDWYVAKALFDVTFLGHYWPAVRSEPKGFDGQTPEEEARGIEAAKHYWGSTFGLQVGIGIGF